MGLVLSYFCPPAPQPLTEEERDHLNLLGSIAGTPSIMVDAVNSGNIFDPAHIERAQEMNKRWEEGVAVLSQFMAARDTEAQS